MTISYPDNFLRVLFRWKGSAWKAVWKEILLWLVLYFGIRLIIDFVAIDAESQTKAKNIIETFDNFTKKVPLEFLLGFYVVQVVGRWWKQVQRLPWPDDAMALICALCPADDRESRLRRHTVARYLVLCETLALRSISTRIRKRFPNPEQLVEAGLMLENELKLYKECPCPNTRWQLPLEWIIHSVILPMTGPETGKIPLVVTTSFMNNVNMFRARLRELFIYDWICIPLVYTQTVSVVVYGYFGMCLIGHQFYGKETDIYIPVLAILQFFFYVGWFKVAQDLMRPFGEDDDDVELNCIVDRHAAVAFSMANFVCNNNPPMAEDGIFKNMTKGGREAACVRIPYSKMSLNAARDHPPKLHASVNIATIEQTEMVFRKPTWFRTVLERSSSASAVDQTGTANAAATGPNATGGPLRRCKTLLKWATGPRDQERSHKESAHF